MIGQTEIYRVEGGVREKSERDAEFGIRMLKMIEGKLEFRFQATNRAKKHERRRMVKGDSQNLVEQQK